MSVFSQVLTESPLYLGGGTVFNYKTTDFKVNTLSFNISSWIYKHRSTGHRDGSVIIVDKLTFKLSEFTLQP